MQTAPTQAELVALGISQPYASLILAGKRPPSNSLAIHIFRNTGWRHPSIDDLTEDQMAFLEARHPWQPARRRAA